jgi:hypothetical protein
MEGGRRYSEVMEGRRGGVVEGGRLCTGVGRKVVFGGGREVEELVRDRRGTVYRGRLYSELREEGGKAGEGGREGGWCPYCRTGRW